jgi:hypothetical protein
MPNSSLKLPMRWTAFLLAILMTAASLPVANAQDDALGPLATDPEGDVDYLLAEGQSMQAADDHGPADIVGLDLSETHDLLIFTMSVANLDQNPAGSGLWIDAASIDVRFWVGDIFYNVRSGIGQGGFPESEIRGGQTDTREPTIQTNLETTMDGASFIVEVPRDLIRDHNGAPVQKGMSLRDLHVDSHVHATGIFFPDPDGEGTIQPLGIRDRLPDEGSIEIPILQGGPQSSGPVSLSSPAPFRASNGGEGTFQFKLDALQLSESERLYELEFDDVPSAWNVQFPDGLLRLPPGVPAKFSILVETPFGHQHGGSESLTFRIVDQNDTNHWASVEVGLYYVAVPQPSGHHPIMWFHSAPAGQFFGTDVQTALGGANGEVYMNTIEGAGDDGDVDDQQVPVQGWTGMPNSDTFRWAVCMQPELQMGLDLDLDALGSITIPLQSARGYSDVIVQGRVMHLGPGDDISNCFSPQYADRHATEIATFSASEPVTLDGNTKTIEMDVTPLEAGDYISFQAGSMLVVEFTADPADLTPVGGVGGPEAMQLMPGGQIHLPLLEFYDARPGGLIGLNEGDEKGADNATLDSVEFVPPADTQESPSAPFLLLVGALAALVIIRRRR